VSEVTGHPSVVNSSGGWTGGGNALTLNGVGAFYSSTTATGFLVLRDYGFGLPADAEVTGLKVRARYMLGTSGVGAVLNVRPTQSGSLIGSSVASSALNSTSFEDVYVGGPGELFGLSSGELTGAFFNQSSTGFSFRGTSDSATTWFLDYTELTVYYTVATFEPTEGSGALQRALGSVSRPIPNFSKAEARAFGSVSYKR